MTDVSNTTKALSHINAQDKCRRDRSIVHLRLTSGGQSSLLQEQHYRHDAIRLLTGLKATRHISSIVSYTITNDAY